MAANDKMDRGLDDIIAENRSNGPRNRRNGGGAPRGGRRERQEGPRDGIRKSYRNEPRNLDGEWVHDRYEDNNNYRRAPAPRRRQESPEAEASGTKLRVENIHYDLTQEDLDELFKRIGPISKLHLRYDRAGRSEGVAFVVYENKQDAQEAIQQFDGANANGQPIRLSIMPDRRGRNPFDSAIMPGRPLSERITAPDGRDRSQSPSTKYSQEDAVRKGIDRYIPGQGGRDRSPGARRRGGRRPGARREGGPRERDGGRDSGREGGREGGRDGGRDSGRGGRGGGNPRSKKTQEELDAEMADYFGGNASSAAQATNGSTEAPATEAAPQTTSAPEDIDMIE